jgi:branched-subunit amino acid transport protein AzlD
MPSTSYLVAVLAIVFTITLALRAAPFAVLRTLHTSAIVRQLSAWMPVGILAILAVTTAPSPPSRTPRGAHSSRSPSRRAPTSPAAVARS